MAKISCVSSFLLTCFVVSVWGARSRVGVDVFESHKKCSQIPDQLALQFYGKEGFSGPFYIPDDLEATSIIFDGPDDATEDVVGDVVRTGNQITKADCHATCQLQTSCSYWQHVAMKFETTGFCFIYKGTSMPRCESSSPFPSTIGTRNRPSIEGDPHLVGAKGTRFDFEGTLDDSYCLTTDEMLHINVYLGGYKDTRVLAGKYAKESNARSWIQKIGIIWTANGVEHKLLLESRRGTETERGIGFMEKMELDGTVQPRLQEGEMLSLSGGLRIKLLAVEEGAYSVVDWYSVKIANLLDIDVRLAVADPILRTATDAEVHFGLGFNFVKRTSQVHGILGQTYRENEGREDRAAHFIELERQKEKSIIADGPSGKGFLDGERSNYKSSGILKPDCLYSAYGSRSLPDSRR